MVRVVSTSSTNRCQRGWTTRAEPPPRRLGSDTAVSRPSRPNSIAVAAPISAALVHWSPAGVELVAVRREQLAVLVDERRLRDRPSGCCPARRAGRRSPPGSDICRSTRLKSIWVTVVMIVDAARRSERKERLAVAQHDRRRDRRPRPLAGLDAVRVGGVVLGAEVGQLVVEQEAAARHQHPGAAGLLDGERVLHDVAPPVGDREVGRLAVLGVTATWCPETSRRCRTCRRSCRRPPRRPVA